MKILVRNALIVDTHSTHNGSIKDILIHNNTIVSIASNIPQTADTIIDINGTIASNGWVDCFAHFCDPGFEYKETLETGANAAIAGGYTHVFSLPNTNPLVQTKSQVEYILQKSANFGTTIHPLGAVTKNVEGKDLAEMYDMYASGAIAFSDGLQPVQTSGLLLKALQYIKAFDGTIIQLPIDKSIGTYGLMNEGIISTKLGIQGIPAIAEEIIIKRDIDLAKYTESKLHITGVSTAQSINLIQKAKAEGIVISCSVTPYHLFFCDEDLQDYNTNLKVNPPLRSKTDMIALQNAVADGTIDCIASHHLPQDWDKKVCEFEYAGNGMIGLQSSFAAVNHVMPQLSNEKIVALFSSNARSTFNLPAQPIEVGNIAELTLFHRTEKTIITKQSNKSKSVNTPFLDKELIGKVLGIINKGNLYLNQ